MTDHGYNAYARGCRCEACRAAKAAYMRGKRAAGKARARQLAAVARAMGRPARAPVVSPEAQHGTRAGYDYHGCRCHWCRLVKTAARNADYARQSERAAS